MLDTAAYTAIAGMVTAILGVLANLIAEKITRQRKLEKETFEDALESSKARAEEAKASVVEALSHKLPDGISAEELADKLSADLKIAGDIVVNQVVKPQTKLIEDLVNGYHQQALSQARVQFWFSVAAATVGFGYIIYAASDFSADNWTTILKILPGIVIDAIAVLFFRQAEQTRQRATELYDRLRTDSQAVMAKELLTTIDDTKVRSIAQAQIAMHLSGLTTKDFDITSLVDRPVDRA